MIFAGGATDWKPSRTSRMPLVAWIVFSMAAIRPVASAQVFVIAWSVPAATDSGLTAILPYIDGVTIPLDWSAVDQTTCTSVPCTTSYPGLNWTTWDNANLKPYTTLSCGGAIRGTSHNCYVNIVVRHISNGGNNTSTPSYVFGNNWADTVAQKTPWQPSTLYYNGAVITPNPSNTYYYQLTTSVSCMSNSTPPTWLTTANSSTNEASPSNCKWLNVQLSGTPQAPALDTAVCSSTYAGGIPSWSAGSYTLDAIITSGYDGVHVTTGQGQYYREQVSSCTTNGGGLGMNPNNWSSGGGTSMDGSCQWKDLGTGATLNVNTNPATDPASVVGNAMPAIWEGPYAYAYELFNNAMIAHYVGVSFASNIRYVRVGLSIGGEASTACMSATNGFESLLSPSSDAQIKTMWTNAATSSYANNLAAWTTTVPTWYLMSTINMGSGLASGTDQTWAITEANGILANQPYAIGSQSLENGVPVPGTTLASDLFSINNGASCSGGNCCADNWCNARPITVGRVPFIELQDCNISKAAGGGTGCLSSSLANTAPDDSPTLSQVFVLSSQHGTNVQEIYFSDLLCAFDPTDSRVPSTCTNGVHNAYNSAILALSAGQPSGTGSIFGNKASTLGAAIIF